MRFKLLLGLIFLMFIVGVGGTVTHTLNAPDAYAEQTSTSMLFNWTPLLVVNESSTTYLYLNNPANETTVFNTSLQCNGNNTPCILTVAGLNLGFYKWYVKTADSGNNATVTATNTEPFDFVIFEAAANKVGNQSESFDFILSEANASMTGNYSEPFNLTDYLLQITYTMGGSDQNCSVSFSNESANIFMPSLLSNISANCNVSSGNSTNGNLTLESNGVGNDEYINVTGNATTPLGLSIAQVLGTQVNSDTLLITYTVNASEEQCAVTLSGDSFTAEQVATNITRVSTNVTSGANCNVTAADDGNGNISLSTSTFGNDEYLNVSGNSTDVLGLTTARVIGTQENNNTLSIEYTVNGTAETCTVTFAFNDSQYASDVISNITSATYAACNLTAQNVSGAINLTTNGKGADEYINITGGNATGVLGFTIGVTLGTEDTTDSVSRWFEIRDSDNWTYFRWDNETEFNAMNLSKDTGDLSIAGDLFAQGGVSLVGNLVPNANNTGYIGLFANLWGNINVNEIYINEPPAECSSGFGMTRFLGNTSICVRFVNAAGDNYLYITNSEVFMNETHLNGTIDHKVFLGNTSLKIASDDSYVNITGDNMTGDLNIVGNLNMPGYNITAGNIISSTPVHCHSYSSQTQTITNMSTYKVITFEINKNCEGGMSTDNQNFTVPNTGVYQISVDLFADKTGGPTGYLEAIILDNGVQMNGSVSQRTVSSNNEVGYFAINAEEDLSANDVISIGITGSTALMQLHSQPCLLCEQNVSARISIEIV